MQYIVEVLSPECGRRTIYGPFESRALANEWVGGNVNDSYIIEVLPFIKPTKKNTVEWVGIGKQFRLNNTTYIRVPEITLQCNGWDCPVNVVLVENLKPSGPPKFVATYLFKGTIVEMI